MDPLSAFQTLVLTVAAAVALKAIETRGIGRWAWFTGLVVLAGVGILAKVIANAWPAASDLMIWLGSNPAPFFLVFLGALLLFHKPWSRVQDTASASPVATGGTSTATPTLTPSALGPYQGNLERIEALETGTRELEARLGDSLDEVRRRVEQNFQAQLDLPAKIQAISEGIEALKNRVAALQDRLEATGASFEAIDKKQARTDRAVSLLLAAYVLANLKPSAEEFQEGVRAAQRSQTRDHGLLDEAVERNLAALGADMEAIGGEIEQNRARIMGDAQFLTLKDDDERERWKQGEYKRIWCLWISRLVVLSDAYIRVTEELKGRAKLDHRKLERLFRD